MARPAKTLNTPAAQKAPEWQPKVIIVRKDEAEARDSKEKEQVAERNAREALIAEAKDQLAKRPFTPSYYSATSPRPPYKKPNNYGNPNGYNNKPRNGAHGYNKPRYGDRANNADNEVNRTSNPNNKFFQHSKRPVNRFSPNSTRKGKPYQKPRSRVKTIIKQVTLPPKQLPAIHLPFASKLPIAEMKKLHDYDPVYGALYAQILEFIEWGQALYGLSATFEGFFAYGRKMLYKGLFELHDFENAKDYAKVATDIMKCENIIYGYREEDIVELKAANLPKHNAPHFKNIPERLRPEYQPKVAPIYPEGTPAHAGSPFECPKFGC